jgi:TP901 family phage tail tape measure protein
MLGVHIGMAALTAAAVTATQEATAFGKAMAEVNTLIPDSEDMDRLTRSVRNLSKEFGTRKLQQAKALYQIISAGATDAAEANFILEQSNILAVGGVTDIAIAADGLTSILNAYGPAATNAAAATDAMFVAMRVGKTTIDELSRAVGLVAPLAAEAGVSLEELLAAASALTSGGIRTRLAFTGLRQIIASIVKPTTEARYAAQQLGIEFNAFALYEQGLEGFLKTLEESTGGSVEALAQLFGGVEALVPVLALTGRQSQQFAENLEAMKQKAGEARQAMGLVGESAAQSFARFRETASDVLLQFGNSLLKLIVPALETMTRYLENADIAVKALAQGIKDAAKALALFATGGLALIIVKNIPFLAGLGRTILMMSSFKVAVKAAVVALTGQAGLAQAFKLVLGRINPWIAAFTIAATVVGVFAKRAYDSMKEIENLQDGVDEFSNKLAKIDLSNISGAYVEVQNEIDNVNESLRVIDTLINVYNRDIANLRAEQPELHVAGATRAELTKAAKEWQRYEKEIATIQEDIDRNQRDKEAQLTKLAEAEAKLAEIVVLRNQASIEYEARRTIMLLEEQRAREEQARAELRLKQQLEDRILDLTATSVDNQLVELERLTIAWEETFGSITPAIQDQFDKLTKYIQVEGIVDDVKRAFNQLSTIDLSKTNFDMVTAYDLLIAQLKIQLALVREGDAAYRDILASIREIERAQASIAVSNVFDFDTRQLDIRLRELRQGIRDGIIDEADWAEGAGEAINTFFNSIQEKIDAADLEKFGHEILSAFEDLSLQGKIEFPGFNFDESMADARTQLALHKITQEEFAKIEQQAKDAFNSVILQLIDIVDNKQLKVALANILKLDEDVDEKNYRKIALEIERAGRASLQILQAFGLINDETAEMLEGMVQIGANIGGAFAGDLNSIAQVIGGIAQVFSNIFGGEDEAAAELREAINNNTIQMRRLNEGLIDLGEFKDLSGAIFTDVYRLVKELNFRIQNDIQTYTRELLKDWENHIEDIQRVADILGIEFNAMTGAIKPELLEQFFDALDQVNIGQIFDDAASQIDLLNRRIALFDLDPFETLDELRKQFLDLVDLDPITEAILAMADATTDQGRQAIIEMLRNLFENFENMTFGQFGELSPQQFLDFIDNMYNAATAAQDFADDVNKINDSLKNIPEGFKVALARFEAIDPTAIIQSTRPPLPPIQPPTGLEPYVPGNGNRRGATVIIEEGAIVIEGITDPEAVAEAVLSALKNKSQILYGDTSEWARL